MLERLASARMLEVRRALGWIAAAAVLAAGAALLLRPHVPAPRIAKGKPALRKLVAPVGLGFAKKRYVARGNRYSLGNNDCSTFVTDYLKGSRVPLTSRLTTYLLYRPWLVPSTGLKAVYRARPGDVLVYRYGKNEGHCGVVASLDGGLIVFHNAASAGGLKVDSIYDWVHDARSKPNAKGVRVLRLPNGGARLATITPVQFAVSDPSKLAKNVPAIGTLFGP